MTTETQITHNIRIITIQTGENIICNHKAISDFVREYKTENVVVRTAAE